MGVNSRYYWERFMLGNMESRPARVVQAPLATGYVQGGYTKQAQPIISNSSWFNSVTVPAVHVSDAGSYSAVMKEYFTLAQEMQTLSRVLQDKFLDMPFEIRQLGTMAYIEDITATLSVSLVAWTSFSAREVTVTTTTPHGLSVGDRALFIQSGGSLAHGEIITVITVPNNTDFSCQIREVDWAVSPPAPKYAVGASPEDVLIPCSLWWPNAVFREMRYPLPVELSKAGYAYDGFEFDFECGSETGYTS